MIELVSTCREFKKLDGEWQVHISRQSMSPFKIVRHLTTQESIERILESTTGHLFNVVLNPYNGACALCLLSVY